MNDLVLFFKLGLSHVLDLRAYDHILFLLVLVVPYATKQWRDLFALITVFTIGHTLTLALATYGVLNLKSNLIEFLIPLTIFVTALVNLFSGVKTKTGFQFKLFLTFAFGWIHGLGFSYYLQMLLSDTSSKMFPLIEFAIGIEAAQLIIAFIMLVVFVLVNKLLHVSKRDWTMVLSAIVIGVVIPMMQERWEPFLKSLLV
jgi:hypothetical protein